MNERGGNRGIDAPRQAEDDFLLARFGANAADHLCKIVWHIPVRTKAADAMEELSDQRLALQRVGDFRMELHAIESARFIGHARDWRRGVARDDLEPKRQGIDFVAMAHPDVEQAVALGVAAVFDALEQLRMAACPYLGVAEFPHQSVFDHPAKLRCHGLHAITNAPNRDAEFEYELGRARRTALGDRGGPAGKDDAFRRKAAQKSVADVVGMQFAVHAGFAHAPRNQLAVLGAEVEDQNLIVHRKWTKQKTGE